MAVTLVSIVIPVYPDRNRPTKCLRSLTRQAYPAASFEILVVNNENNDLFTPVVSLPRNCCRLHESILGSYAARNAAPGEAEGRIIGFSDSDWNPEPNWIEAAVVRFAARFKQAVRFLTDARFKRDLEDPENSYGYGYNAPGFEIPYCLQVLSALPQDTLNAECTYWVEQQMAHTWNPETKCFDRNTADPVTLTARLYESTRALQLNHEHNGR